MLAAMQIWADTRFDTVPEPKRKELFQEYRALLGEVEAYNRASAAKQAAKGKAAEAAEKAQPCLLPACRPELCASHGAGACQKADAARPMTWMVQPAFSP